MLLDNRLRFLAGTALAGSAGTAKRGEAIDLSVAPTDQGEGYPLYLVILCTGAPAGGTSAQFNLVTADNEALSSNPVTLLSTPAIATAALLAGVQLLVVPLPKATYKRWLGITVTEVGTFSTPGTFEAFLVQDPPNWRAYAEGNN